ncbi:PD-(D/E)XK nuclease family protein [Chitinispirillales bacterium ANBcel5]|uniref:hypothetical protein n=1 Tax=Cellulosispirillum alkaliphilum TaxID=3039283 RepID=UPI002A55D7C6|nr:PD-(D/E)XK nuclease family protein [Chitinispirillales bacterium ANBcel5]
MSKTVSNFLSRKRHSPIQHFSLEKKHGLFVPSIDRKFKDVRTHSFKHQWFYRYRVHYPRLESINGSLSKFLTSSFENCPNHVFQKSRFRCSKCNTFLDLKLNHYTEHEIIDLAKQSRIQTSLKERHENLQKFFLENDRHTISVEVPLWAESNEFSDYTKCFGTCDAMTGHVDLLRYIPLGDRNFKVQIWDYKPGAYKEKYAMTQVFLYAFMLSLRTGISFRNIECGYFDEVDAFTFMPEQANAKTLEQLKKATGSM